MVISSVEGHITGVTCDNGSVLIASETIYTEYLFPYNMNVPKKSFDCGTLDRRKVRITVELL